MRIFVVLLVSAVALNGASAGPIWDRARRMFGWDKPEESQQNVAVAPHYPHGGPQGYPASGPPQKSPPAASSSYGGSPGPSSYASAYRPSPYAGRPDLQHASSAAYGSYAQPSYAAPPSYMKPPMSMAYGGGYPSAVAGAYGSGVGAYGSGTGAYGSGAGAYAPGAFGSLGGTADYGAPTASNNYGGLFSVVDQTSQIGQLANGDLAAAPSEPYASNEDVMKSLLKMVDKPFDLETAASGSHYFGHSAQLALNPGPHPIMEADKHVIRYRTSPIQIGVASPYAQHVSQPVYTSAHLSHAVSAHHPGVSYAASSGALTSSGAHLAGASYGDLHAAASAPLKKAATGAGAAQKTQTQ